MIKRLQPVALLLFLLLNACVSGPGEQPPQSLQDAQSLLSQGVARYQASQYQVAYQLFEQALDQYRLLDNPEGIVSSSINIARVLHASGNPERAQKWLRQADRLNQQYQPANQQELSAHITLLQATIDIEQNKLDAAAEQLEQLLDNTQNNEIKLATLQLRSRIAQLQNRDTNIWLQRFSKAVKANGANLHRARLMRLQAQATTDYEEQSRLFMLALEQYRQLANKAGIASTLTEWAQADITTENHTAAENKLLRALRIRLALQDAKRSSQILESLQVVYEKQKQQAKLQRVNNWLDKLSSADFNQWQTAARSFDNYPK